MAWGDGRPGRPNAPRARRRGRGGGRGAHLIPSSVHRFALSPGSHASIPASVRPVLPLRLPPHWCVRGAGAWRAAPCVRRTPAAMGHRGKRGGALYLLRLEPSHERRRRPHPPIVELAGVEPNPHRSATGAAVGGRVGDALHIVQRCRSTGGRITELPDVVGGDRLPDQTAIAAMDDEPKSRTPLRGAARTTHCPPPRSPPSSATHRPNPSPAPSRAPPSGNWSRDAPLFTARYRLV